MTEHCAECGHPRTNIISHHHSCSHMLFSHLVSYCTILTAVFVVTFVGTLAVKTAFTLVTGLLS